MATERKQPNEKREKKPPAHKVIVTQLRSFARHRYRDAPLEVGDGESVRDDGQPGREHHDNMIRVNTLILILMRMHIPEKDRSWVMDALKHLPPYFLPADVFAEIEGDKGGA